MTPVGVSLITRFHPTNRGNNPSNSMNNSKNSGFLTRKHLGNSFLQKFPRPLIWFPRFWTRFPCGFLEGFLSDPQGFLVAVWKLLGEETGNLYTKPLKCKRVIEVREETCHRNVPSDGNPVVSSGFPPTFPVGWMR